MGTGKLIVNVYSDNIAQPITNATVEILINNRREVYNTNEFGQTKEISLSCPDKVYSLEPQTNTRPYSVYNIRVSKQSHRTAIIDGIQIFDSVTSIQDIYLKSSNLEFGTNYIPIGNNVLWGNYPPKIVEDPKKLVVQSPFILPVPVVPEYIVVHDGLPNDSSASNYIVDFKDYIKNVASSEIYSTWPVETLKANILAILSFTLNRVYLEWYVSRGYNFTITSSTAYDQCFIYGRNIFKEISNVVDDIFNNYISVGSSIQPFFSQYCDGITVNRPGWLSQWGSKALGDQGYTALQIIRYYYSNDKNLKTANVIDGLPQSYPGRVLEVGMCGEAIQEAQLELNVINGAYPGIPKIIPTDGKYTTSTENTVKIFQQVFELPVTGKIDFATWYKISAIYAAVNKNYQKIFGV